MFRSDGPHGAHDFPPPDGPRTPDEDDAFGAEPDDPRAAGRFDDPFDVPDFDPAHEQRDMCRERARS